MATLGSFAKVPRWHWQSTAARAVKAKTRIADGSRRTDNGRGYSAADPAEIGAAWKKTAQDGGREYLSVKLDDPSFAQPIYASLVEAEGGKEFNLIWSRRNGN